MHGGILDACIVQLCKGLSAGIGSIQMRELRAKGGGLQFVQATVATVHPVLVLFGCTIVGIFANQCRQLRIVCHDSSAIAQGS